MRQKRTIFLFYLLLVGFSISVSGQEVVATSGGSYQAGSISLDWTLGECMSETYSTQSIVLTQGFLQPEYLVTSMEVSPELSFQFTLYPVPATDFINIEIGDDRLSDLKGILFDMNGNQVIYHDFNTRGSQLDLQHLPAAGYILQISNKEGEFLKSYKIVKQ